MQFPKPVFQTVFAFLAMSLAFLTEAEAYYLKKITVVPVKNESGWTGEFDPGSLITDILIKKIEKSRLMVVSPGSGKGHGLNPGVNANEKFLKGTSQLILRARLLRFKPGKRPPPRPRLSFEKPEKPVVGKKLRALAQLKVELINGFTGKSFWSHDYVYRSLNGDLAMGETPASLDPLQGDFYRTAMGQVLDHTTNQILERVLTFANNQMLEGQIVALSEKESEQRVFMNIGRHNGVEVGDTFQVFRVSSEYRDPLNEEDLGYWYHKVGAIRIADVQPGFAVGVVRAGENFVQGHIVRAAKLNPFPYWKKKKRVKAVTRKERELQKAADREKAPFESPVREVPHFPNKVTQFNLLDIVHWTLAY
ncbi:exported hypothetical protein [Nitrospina gracilis 3/211]|uniref:Flagellar assembly protein T C-terminal domain-containing protein n=1 Tax=Nitrospina gracilis (strain 3/211) TaxID=1266370 RepID=M1Z0S7_NITG3|nr:MULTISPECIES: FlgT C-terminal domain-containing protein [Nitrospina]MCF8724417.1 hypothetical protein [Nitrospina sp. Nb-3]CCQ91574.1 exported hypothetical protein [Nitrospina gracilis 3/211]